MDNKEPSQRDHSSARISSAERGIALALAVVVLLTLIILVLHPRNMDGGTLAIVRFLAATFAGISGYLFSGNLGLEANIPLSKIQVRATGAFAAFVLVLFIFFVGIPNSSDSLESSNLSQNVSSHDFFSPEDSICNFSGKHPENWTYQVLNNPISQEIMILSPVENGKDLSEANVIFQCSKPQEIVSLSEYIEDFLSRRKRTFEISGMHEKDTLVSNRKARQLTYVANSNSEEWMFREVVSLSEGIVYQITYRASKDGYQYYMKQVDQIIESFRIA